MADASNCAALARGSFSPYHHVSWAFVGLSVSCFRSTTDNANGHTRAARTCESQSTSSLAVGWLLGCSLSRWVSNSFRTFVSVDREGKRGKKSMIIQGHLLFQYIQDKKKRKQFKNRMYLHSRLYLPCPSPSPSLSFYNQKLHRICVFFNQKIKPIRVKPTSVPSRG